MEEKTNYKKLNFATGIAHENRLPPIDAAKKAVEKGYTHFYINTEKKQLSDNTIRDLKKIVSENNLKPIVHSHWRNEISSSIETIRQKACNCIFKDIEISHKMNAPLIVHGTIDSSFKTEKVAYRNALYDFKDGFGKIRRQAALRNVELWIENLPNNEAAVFTNDDEYKIILDAFKDVKFLYDIGHGNVKNNPMLTFEKFYKKIIALSLSDNNGHNDSHEQLGNGNIDFTRLIEMIHINNWRGVIIFDIHKDEVESEINYLNAICSNHL